MWHLAVVAISKLSAIWFLDWQSWLQGKQSLEPSSQNKTVRAGWREGRNIEYYWVRGVSWSEGKIQLYPGNYQRSGWEINIKEESKFQGIPLHSVVPSVVQKYDIFWLGPCLIRLFRIPRVSSSSSVSMTWPDVQDCKNQDNYSQDPIWSQRHAATRGWCHHYLKLESNFTIISRFHLDFIYCFIPI